MFMHIQYNCLEIESELTCYCEKGTFGRTIVYLIE